MPHHGREMLALTDLMSSIQFSPQELRRLRFEADEGLTSHKEAEDRIDSERLRCWTDRNFRFEQELINRNVAHGRPYRPHSRYDDSYRPGYEEMDESKPWMKREIDALKRELKDAINEKGRREGMRLKGIDDIDQYDADDHDASLFEQQQTSPTNGIGEGSDLKAYMREELGQVKKELQDSVIEGKCRCRGKRDNVGAGDSEEGEKSPKTRD